MLQSGYPGSNEICSMGMTKMINDRGKSMCSSKLCYRNADMEEGEGSRAVFQIARKIPSPLNCRPDFIDFPFPNEETPQTGVSCAGNGLYVCSHELNGWDLYGNLIDLRSTIVPQVKW